MPATEELDMAAAVADIGSGLGLDTDTGEKGHGHAVDTADDVDLGTDPDGARGGADADEPAVDVGSAAKADAPAGEADALAEAPKTWRKEAAAVWGTLPAEARAEILKREEDVFRGIEAYKADAGFGKSLKGVMSPYMPILQEHGIDPVGQVQSLMHAHYTLASGTPQQKVELFQRLADDYQVDLGQLSASAAERPYVDPAVAALQTDVRAVQSQLSAAERARQAEVRTNLEAQIEKFAADPANAHFQDVANDMAILLEKGVCKTLPEAYERAVWMNPAVRAKEIASQQAAASKKAQDEAAARTAAARKAQAANVRTSAKNGSAAAPLGSIDDTLMESLAAIRSRG